MQQKEENLYFQMYYETLSVDELLRIKEETEFEIKCLGEMSESALNGSEHAKLGPSVEECEIQINESKKHLDFIKIALKEKKESIIGTSDQTS